MNAFGYVVIPEIPVIIPRSDRKNVNPLGALGENPDHY